MQYLRQMLSHDITFGIGPAGAGKTFAVACAVDALERQGVQRIVLARAPGGRSRRAPGLPARRPGAEGVDPYLCFYDALYDLMGFDRVTRAFEKGQIEIRAAGVHARAHVVPRSSSSTRRRTPRASR
ncbi:MAG: PhoH family protein [Rubrivivax sp.]